MRLTMPAIRSVASPAVSSRASITPARASRSALVRATPEAIAVDRVVSAVAVDQSPLPLSALAATAAALIQLAGALVPSVESGIPPTLAPPHLVALTAIGL